MRTLIAIPCMDMVHTSFMKSLLGLMRVGDCGFSVTCSSLVYDARNMLAAQAIQEQWDRVLFLDSDMVFGPELLYKLSQDLDEGKEMVCGLYFKRKPPFNPVMYKNLEYSTDPEKGVVNVKIDTYEDYPKDQIFEVAACGFGAVLITTDLIARIGEKFGAPFSPLLGLGEDLTFCYKASQLGVPMYCDSRIKVGHVGLVTVNEQTYQSTR